tara:strand:+ start:710 stop:1063 length:354 start_codon:yes stop_codon:yes gene_type:complete
MKNDRPETMAEAVYMANQPRVFWYSASSGSLDLAITWDDAVSCSVPGQDATEAVRALAALPYIAEQLEDASADLIRAELRECGAWDAKQLADDEENRLRILWIACCDIRENSLERTA